MQLTAGVAAALARLSAVSPQGLTHGDRDFTEKLHSTLYECIVVTAIWIVVSAVGVAAGAASPLDTPSFPSDTLLLASTS